MEIRALISTGAIKLYLPLGFASFGREPHNLKFGVYVDVEHVVLRLT